MGRQLFNSLIRSIILYIVPCILIINVKSQWTLQYYDTNYFFREINFINENTGFAAGEKFDYINNIYKGIIVKTTNSGDNWNIVFLDTNIFLFDSYFINIATGYAVGGFWSWQSKMLRTTNGGNNWLYIDQPDITSSIASIVFFGNIAYASGIYGLFKSTDGASSWTRVLGFFTQWGSSYFLDVNTGWAFADNGFVYKTTNGGLNWNSSFLNYGFSHEAQFVNANTGYFICDSTEYHYYSKILKTTNGGLNWFLLNPGLQNHHWSVHFINENTGYISGNGGEVIKTTNAGESWTISWTGVQWTSLADIKFINAYTGYACGGSGVIIKTTCGGFIGISPISNEIPKEFMLYQNYPNPFNPTTNIKFAISNASNVKLIVFDMLGREVQTLVNEYVLPGIYQVKWDASGFSSGIYFYKLFANEFSIVKKMTFIK